MSDERKLRLTREVTKQECRWLHSDIRAGVEVYEFKGCTYGAIGPDGRAVSFQRGENPFFQLPDDALEPA